MMDDSHLLDSEALALVGHSDEQGRGSMIMTTHGTYLSKTTPLDLLNAACLRSGVTKAARKREASRILKSHHKSPFLLSGQIGVFPTSSSRHPTCFWIFNRFFTPSVLGKQQTRLTFSNGAYLDVPVSLHTIHHQSFRLQMLLLHAEEHTPERRFPPYGYPTGGFPH